MYNFAHLPKNHELLNDINLAASRLCEKLKFLDINSLDISDYNKRYLNNYLRNIYSILQRYSYILAWSVAYSNIPLNEFVFLDYGGGSGILSLLAKELNLGTVIYNDIYDVSCKDVKIICDSIGNQIDYYILGDIDDVISFLRKNSISCNAIASNDVIEHIYDIEGFLKKLHVLSDESLNVVMTSGANIFNSMTRKSKMAKHIEIEYKDREKKWGHKERDCLSAYFKVRKEIIRKYNRDLSDKEVVRLAMATRGKVEADIKKSIDDYLELGHFPEELNHPTNTCDPYTGNWAEKLMDPYSLKEILSNAGFNVKVLSGYYGHHKNIIKRFLSVFLNLAIYIFKKQGIRIASFFTIYGRRSS
jgi:2-polyprenyl-3-methyl-5-hydroxy-6-metoxy-1,4-benzoquinol methylase